jgi:hypothetical protein
LEEFLDEVKVKDVLEHGNVILDRIDDFNRQISILFRANLREINLLSAYSIKRQRHLRNLSQSVLLDLLCDLVNLVGDAFRSRSTIREIILDSKVRIGSYHQLPISHKVAGD